MFHADLHPRNIFVDTDGTVALAARLDRQDTIAATDAPIDLLGAPPGLDDRALERQLGQLIVRHAGGLGTGSSAKLYRALAKLVLTYRLSSPHRSPPRSGHSAPWKDRCSA